MRLRTLLPSAALAPYVEAFIISENDSAQTYVVLPDTALVMGFQYRGQLSVVGDPGSRPLSAAGITGLQQEHRRFQHSQAIGTLLVKFRPGGAAAFFPMPMHELFGQSVSLDSLACASDIRLVEEQLSGARSDTGRIRVVEDFLCARKTDAPQDQLVSAAVRLIQQSGGTLRIPALARQLHTSASPLEKKFRSLMGASPKQFAQIVRFRHVLSSVHSSMRPAAKAYEAGYFDQAHFIKDFRRFTGQTPQAFFGKNSR